VAKMGYSEAKLAAMSAVEEGEHQKQYYQGTVLILMGAGTHRLLVQVGCEWRRLGGQARGNACSGGGATTVLYDEETV